MATEAKLLIVQFLHWVAARPRRYAEIREAWSSTCPLNCAWEDAIAEGLVRHQADGHIESDRARARPARTAGRGGTLAGIPPRRACHYCLIAPAEYRSARAAGSKPISRGEPP